MPYLKNSTYKAPWYLRAGHLSTIYSGALKRVSTLNYRRQRCELADGDFLDIDCAGSAKERLVILCHGLGGSSQSTYVNSAAHYFLKHDYAVYAWNNRSCSGELNRLPLLYHHASVEDLDAVVKQGISDGFKAIYLLGFSMGGAQILNYFGRLSVPDEVKAGAAISAPISIAGSTQKIASGFSRIYEKRFVKKMRLIVEAKAEQFPKRIDFEAAHQIKSFEDLAKAFIVPIHGYKSLEDYNEAVSPQNHLSKITTPTLLLNALDDPILGNQAYPVELAKNHPDLWLETPKHGGHCGFPQVGTNYAFSEVRALTFFESL